MAERPADPRGLHGRILGWLVDNFCICEGYSLPRCLVYEMYVETCGQNAQNQVNAATFGKLVHLAFPDLGTRRLGTRGSARYHYDGIYMKKSSFFYSQYCCLLGEKRSPSGDVAFEKSIDSNNIVQQERTMAFLADEYCNYCQDILQNVKNQELERVQDLLMSFWKSLQQDIVMFMALPDVCQLLKSYDAQLYKGLEDILLCDFLDAVSIQYLKSVRLFSKKFKHWLLKALEGFPSLLQVSKLKEVTVFVNRLRRKTYLSNMATTMRTMLRNSRRVRLLKSDLQAIISQGALDISPKGLASDLSHTEEPESAPEMKCLSCLISLLGTSTDLGIFLNCLSSHLQVFVFQPSKSKEEFIKQAASFQLKWNFLLTAVSKAMTLCHRDSFGSWHLLHLLLLEYVTHIFQSCLEEEEEEEDVGNPKDVLPDDQSLIQPVQTLFHPLDSPLPQEYESPGAGPPWVTLGHKSHGLSPMGVSSTVLWVLGFLVDTATSNKLVQVLLEDKATKSAMRLSLPMGEEALITLKDGRRFVIHISDVP
ncbi:DNA-binding protein RFX8 isoform X2 [Fukomys damarensis]|uniref:DNA-binding protein RFX8 isoform X2 n=1 Tax=Fukomys damarensis TaxID=885580 RepID=UPI00053FED73|nr:DNA-binding protein RFX8 isoform X2 [Fukomys damarensis]